MTLKAQFKKQLDQLESSLSGLSDLLQKPRGRRRTPVPTAVEDDAKALARHADEEGHPEPSAEVDLYLATSPTPTTTGVIRPADAGGGQRSFDWPEEWMPSVGFEAKTIASDEEDESVSASVGQDVVDPRQQTLSWDVEPEPAVEALAVQGETAVEAVDQGESDAQKVEDATLKQKSDADEESGSSQAKHDEAPSTSWTEAEPFEDAVCEESLSDRSEDLHVGHLSGDDWATFFDEAETLVAAIDNALQHLRAGRMFWQHEGETWSTVTELHRHLHSLKGSVAMVGAHALRDMLHRMESVAEELLPFADDREAPGHLAEVIEDLEKRFNQAQVALNDLTAQPEPLKVPPDTSDAASVGSMEEPLDRGSMQRKTVRVSSELLDRMINEVGEARLARVTQEGLVRSNLALLRESDENVQGFKKMLRELELHADTQIQSRRTQIEETGEEFDPLELDRFTRLQELTRLLSEKMHDAADLHQAIVRNVADQETWLAYQARSFAEMQDGLTKTRLMPFDTIVDQFVRTVMISAREMGKEARCVIVGGSVELDGALLEKIKVPLSHALRNAVAHGIEDPATRAALGKPKVGEIRITVTPGADRVTLTVQDDGGGIDVDKVRTRAIERGLWKADAPMSAQAASDMICVPGFSTVDASDVSLNAGRGVGMDVVRSDVLALGGRFDLVSTPGEGLAVVLQLPTTLTAASTLLVEAANERVCLPVECVETVLLLRQHEVREARARGWWPIVIEPGQPAQPIDFRYLPAVMGVKGAFVEPLPFNQVVVTRDGDTWIAVLVDRLIGVQEVHVRPVGRALSRLPGMVGTTVLADGRAAFVVDPARIRAAFVKMNSNKIVDGLTNPAGLVLSAESHRPSRPWVDPAEQRAGTLVMVVDDSMTVRKSMMRFLQREGYLSLPAKDGQEALEILGAETTVPDLILLDVEMPRMDGFDFAKHVRHHARYKDVPIIMITSRIADKHRKRAQELGVDGYFGKPLKDEELLALLKRYTQSPNGRGGD